MLVSQVNLNGGLLCAEGGGGPLGLIVLRVRVKFGLPVYATRNQFQKNETVTSPGLGWNGGLPEESYFNTTDSYMSINLGSGKGTAAKQPWSN